MTRHKIYPPRKVHWWNNEKYETAAWLLCLLAASLFTAYMAGVANVFG